MKTEITFSKFILLLCLLGLVSVGKSENVKKSIDDNRDDTGDINDENKDESLDIPVENSVENEANNISCTRRANSQMHEILKAQPKQFPFVAAVMSHQNEYLCSGSIVSNGLVLTTASCTTQPGYLLLNTTRDRKDEGAVMLNVIRTEKFPTFTGKDSLKDVGLIYMEKHNSSIASKIRLSNYTSARKLVDIEAIGFGLNADVGQPKDLQFIGMELRSPFEHEDILKAYFDCVETKVPTCFQDTGGPAIFDNELIGVVVWGQEDCSKEMSGTYAIHKAMANVLPTFTFKAWLDEKIKKNEEQEEDELQTYPAQPVQRRTAAHQVQHGKEPQKPMTDQHQLTAYSGCNLKNSINILLVFYPVLALST